MAAAYLLETEWGRKKTLCVSLTLSAVVQLMLLTATGSTATMAIVCFLQQCTAMAVWAVLFAYTPEVCIAYN
jgi:hypothetical protein